MKIRLDDIMPESTKRKDEEERIVKHEFEQVIAVTGTKDIRADFRDLRIPFM
jgi:hypothetical protein